MGIEDGGLSFHLSVKQRQVVKAGDDRSSFILQLSQQRSRLLRKGEQAQVRRKRMLIGVVFAGVKQVVDQCPLDAGTCIAGIRTVIEERLQCVICFGCLDE